MDAPAEAGVATEDARSFKELKEDPLYADRVKIYPKAVSGLFRRIKWAALTVLLGLYYIVPWIRWDRGPNAPDQAVLVDMPGRRLYFFFIEIWPQEIYYLTFLLMAAAFGLFLATSIGGRVWCGFACPQTVWTDLFMWVERKIEGDRAARIRLDKQPWSAERLRKKITTHIAWLVIAAATGGVWIMYFNDAPTVTFEILTGQAGLAVLDPAHAQSAAVAVTRPCWINDLYRNYWDMPILIVPDIPDIGTPGPIADSDQARAELGPMLKHRFRIIAPGNAAGRRPIRADNVDLSDKL